jgi:tRNA-specific adenosine deaminase 3
MTQAETWTKTLWPIVFNPAAPRSFVAPPPQTLSRAQESIAPRAGYYLSLAQKVAQEAFQSGQGRPVGAVIVDPAIDAPTTNEWDEAVLAVAGDARYSRPEGGAPPQAQLHAGSPNPACGTYNADLEGGPELHALMRAVELVARWRREHDSEGAPVLSASGSGDGDGAEPEAKLSALESYFLYRHNPAPAPPSPSLKRKHEDPNVESDILPLESDLHIPLPGPVGEVAAAASRIRTRSQGGYLCTDLDVYLSHEPCLCCSMGMLLSRFRAVIFPRRGRLVSGGLASEPVVGPVKVEIEGEGEGEGAGSDGREYYGLHWRKELNWRALGFEFVENEDGEIGTEMPIFHA